jgi:eukaryotic-like serine/threonine-protein kinase
VVSRPPEHGHRLLGRAAGAVLFLTMELIEGRWLALAIPKGGLPLADLLTIAISLADAIAAAHAKGVTHRVSPRPALP